MELTSDLVYGSLSSLALLMANYGFLNNAEQKNMKKKLEEHSIVIITTDHWTQEWFVNLIIPFSRYATENFQFFDITTGTFDDHFHGLYDLLISNAENSNKVACFAVTDIAMELYSSVLKEIQIKNSNLSHKLTGAHFESFMIATNKLACRAIFPGCDGLKFSAVTTEDKYLPYIAKNNFFKPLAECGSKGVFKYTKNDVVNDLFGKRSDQELHPILNRLVNENYAHLNEYSKDSIVGLIEEYVSPQERKGTYSVDGFITNKNIYFYGISENIYFDDKPEEFDCLVTPAQNISENDRKEMHDLYMKIVKDMVARGLDNQFVDVEMFLFHNGRVEVMEVNCRTYSNQLPIQSRVYGQDECMFSVALDLLLQKEPTNICQKLNRQESHIGARNKEVGVCVYRDNIPNAPSIVVSAEGSHIYYDPDPENYKAHVYVINKNSTTSWKEVRQECEKFYQEMEEKYSTSGPVE